MYTTNRFGLDKQPLALQKGINRPPCVERRTSEAGDAFFLNNVDSFAGVPLSHHHYFRASWDRKQSYWAQRCNVEEWDSHQLHHGATAFVQRNSSLWRMFARHR